jgi:hypothetical protein
MMITGKLSGIRYRFSAGQPGYVDARDVDTLIELKNGTLFKRS